MNYYFSASSVVLLSIFLYIGYKSSKSVNASDSYFLAGRSLGILSVSTSLLASQLGAGVILGTADFSYKYGIRGIFYALGLSLGLVIISIYGAKHLRDKNISTIAELFEKEYKSNFLRKLASLISVVSLYGILISLIVGTKKILLSFGIYNEYILYGFWSTLITYTILGGLKGVVYTHIIQVLFIFCTFTLILTYYIVFKFQYIQFAFDNLLTCKVTSNTSLIPYLIVPCLYISIEQDVAQRLFAAKNSKIAYISAFIAGILLLIFSCIPLIFGIAARSMTNIPTGVSEIVYFFIHTSNSFISSYAALAILCAIISTGDSLLCAITANLILDFKQKTVSTNLFQIRTITLILGFTGILIASYLDQIIELMLLSYQVMICTLFFPITITYLNFKKTTSFAYTSIILGLIAFIVYPKINSYVSYFKVSKELFSISMSLLSFPISYLSNKIASIYYIDKNLIRDSSE